MAEEVMRADVFCSLYHVDVTFITSLHQAGLIHIHTINDESFLLHDELCELEKFVRWHYELDINMEGIEAISHMLQKIRNMQDEIAVLKTRLKTYETEESD